MLLDIWLNTFFFLCNTFLLIGINIIILTPGTGKPLGKSKQPCQCAHSADLYDSIYIYIYIVQ